jgi:flagellar operon protein
VKTAMATINNDLNKIINNLNINSAKQINQSQNKTKDTQGRSFADVLSAKTAENKTLNDIKLRQYQINNNRTQELSFSKHAQQRLAQRNIDIAPELMEKIGDASKKAYDKNIKNALILTDNTAFIVNTENNIVVTMINNSEMRDSIITNIDGTVIL